MIRFDLRCRQVRGHQPAHRWAHFDPAAEPFGQAFGHDLNDPNAWAYPIIRMWRSMEVQKDGKTVRVLIWTIFIGGLIVAGAVGGSTGASIYLVA